MAITVPRAMIEVRILTQDNDQSFIDVTLPCVLGRHSSDETPEMIIADPYVSRRHIELESTPDGRLLVRCIGSSTVQLLGKENAATQSNTATQNIDRGNEQIIDMPAEIRVGRSQVSISKSDPGVTFLHTPIAFSEPQLSTPETLGASLFAEGPIDSERLIRWFENLVALQESVSGRRDLFQHAARTVVDLVGLDRCSVITLAGDRWEIDIEHGDRSSRDIPFSHNVVDLVFRRSQTVFDSSVDLSHANSLNGVSAFVGSPIVDTDANVNACLFGVRHRPTGVQMNQPTKGVLPIEAQLVQLIAGIVSGRLGRLHAEAEQVRSQVQLEQFASPALVREMQSNPQWLDANQRELTLMFGDIRGFSRLSERISPHEVFSLVGDAMDCMTEVIHDHDGFIFNFAGDGIAAMWNAPEQLSDHTSRACQAALEIQQRLPKVMQHWSKRVGNPIRVGLGIHTGNALIGNSGSKHRLKYSPLGHAVNLASRIEGATKQLGVSTLITDAARERIGDTFMTRNLGEITVIGIDETVRVHQLANASDDELTCWRTFERALHKFEGGKMGEAEQLISELRTTFHNDASTNSLLERIRLSNGCPTPWKLDSK